LKQLEIYSYSGIKIAEYVKLYKKDGSYNKQVKVALDGLIKLLKLNNNKLLNEYRGNHEKVLIKFNCTHEPHWITPHNYKQGQGCPKCGGSNPEQAKEELISLIDNNGHLLLSEYINNKTKILIDYKCGHKPHSIIPSSYKRGQGCPRCYGNNPEQSKNN
jgi:hypothetical protein